MTETTGPQVVLIACDGMDSTVTAYDLTSRVIGVTPAVRCHCDPKFTFCVTTKDAREGDHPLGSANQQGAQCRRGTEAHMSPNGIYWMNYAISIGQRASHSGRRVGVALVSEHDELICSAFEGEVRGASWYRTLRSKMQELGLPSAHSAYLTINTLSADCSFELGELLKEVRVDRVCVGLPDPALTRYLDDDPVTARGLVHRFPDDLQREILEQNRDFYAASEQNIECNLHYSTHRISEAVAARLKSSGFALSRSDVNANRGRIALASLICQRYGVEDKEADRAVSDALSGSFDAKYGSYDYAYDARAANSRWTDDFKSVHRRSSTPPLSAVSILNVGVGAGYEAVALFSNCPQITFVDIAERGLAKIRERIPSSRTVVSSAEDLSALPENSYDLYVSLRTYNSSFFDTTAAVREAHRVLKPGAVIIVSVANGFLHPERGCVVPGLIIPGTDFVDIYRGMDTANLIGAELDRAGFKDIRTFPTNGEIYLSAVAA
ncbi:class I SAM-dependent methyltransferase [Streptomyces albipurpureus]|uniref:Methyltransferase domain-containing protein n=1 Tax=Streptomyces albipurpureus TaxID=2897419 RepID=A0ABT0UX80_9ACTN|nr:class I SAM-dependent methyltransferase [Streptomyces sp. CWNU-1]MCM2392720.1 methyltransferase domain-containing protein [Streptomyces sp. CWNU-1]